MALKLSTFLVIMAVTTTSAPIELGQTRETSMIEYYHNAHESLGYCYSFTGRGHYDSVVAEKEFKKLTMIC